MKGIVIKINKLGRVRDSELTIHPFMVFSGESGLGKSYLAMLCHYFFDVMANTRLGLLNHFFIDHQIDYDSMSASFKEEGTALQIEKKDLEEWLASDAIHYLATMLNNDKLRGDIQVVLPSNVPDTLTISYSMMFEGLANEEETYFALTLDGLTYTVSDKARSMFAESPFSVLLRYSLINYVFGDYKKLQKTFLLPPSRGPLLTEVGSAQTGMYIEFLNNRSEIERANPRSNEVDKHVINTLKYIMEGEVSKQENRYMYTTTDGIEMPLSAAAASIKEIAPLQLLVNKFDLSVSSVLIEEPEAHLHPLKQRMMADILGMLSHRNAALQITTHSDYFIRRLNELIIFARIKKLSQETTVIQKLSERTGITEQMLLEIDNIAAYLLEKQEDGSSKAIKQDLTNGVPFATFQKALEDSLNYQDELEDVLNELTKR